MFYQEPFYITGKISNNVFHFEERHKPRLFVPSLKDGTIDDVRIGQEIVFEDFNDEGVLQSCYGLEHFIKTSLSSSKSQREAVPTYIFDNHNHAFYFWCLEFSKKTFKSGALLVHIDQHKDNRAPTSFLKQEDIHDLQKVFEYTNQVLNVGNFIPPAQKVGLIDEVIFLDSEYSLLQMENKKLPEKDVILDLDLDFFCPDMDYISLDLKMNVVRKMIEQARMVTIASSPFFIDQKLAIKRLQEIKALFS